MSQQSIVQAKTKGGPTFPNSQHWVSYAM